MTVAPVPADSTSSSSFMPGISLGLSRIHRLLSLAGSPHLRVPVIHIAGTNGKGSVSAYLSSILASTSPPLRVGRFNSPHLVDEWDCIRLPSESSSARSSGDDPLQPVPEAAFRSTFAELSSLSASSAVNATSFELLTATAFTLFARASPPLDVAVIEVGMGGAEDATNVVPADRTLLSIVTPVDLDHQKFLGDTVGEIASVKAGIVREEGDVVLAVQGHEEAREAVLRVAVERGARVWEAGVGSLVGAGEEGGSGGSASESTALPPPPLVSLPLGPLAVTPPSPSSAPLSSSSASPAALKARLPLPGAYQLSNAAVAVLAASLLRSLPCCRALLPALGATEDRAKEVLSDDAIQAGVGRTRWDGRLQWISLPSPLPSPSSASSDSLPPPSAPSTRLLLLDGAHNSSSASLLASYLSSLPTTLQPKNLIFGLSAPRAPTSVLQPLLEGAKRLKRVMCVGFSQPAGMDWVRAVKPEELVEGVRGVVRSMPGAKGVEVLEAESAGAALRLLDELEAAEGAGARRTTLVAGSLYLVADVLRVQRRVEGASTREEGEE
ncbi:hypothetical protein JCM8097_002389 [Rhodosporidiobolus ruineniae]